LPHKAKIQVALYLVDLPLVLVPVVPLELPVLLVSMPDKLVPHLHLKRLKDLVLLVPMLQQVASVPPWPVVQWGQLLMSSIVASVKKPLPLQEYLLLPVLPDSVV
jgi:hypothetical protein